MTRLLSLCLAVLLLSGSIISGGHRSAEEFNHGQKKHESAAFSDAHAPLYYLAQSAETGNTWNKPFSTDKQTAQGYWLPSAISIKSSITAMDSYREYVKLSRTIAPGLDIRLIIFPFHLFW